MKRLRHAGEILFLLNETQAGVGDDGDAGAVSSFLLAFYSSFMRGIFKRAGGARLNVPGILFLFLSSGSKEVHLIPLLDVIVCV